MEGFLGSLDAASPGWDKRVEHAVVLGAGGAGRAVIYGLMHNSLKMIQTQINSTDKEGTQRFHQIIKGKADADLSNEAVLEALRQAVMDMPKP